MSINEVTYFIMSKFTDERKEEMKYEGAIFIYKKYENAVKYLYGIDTRDANSGSVCR